MNKKDEARIREIVAEELARDRARPAAHELAPGHEYTTGVSLPREYTSDDLNWPVTMGAIERVAPMKAEDWERLRQVYKATATTPVHPA